MSCCHGQMQTTALNRCLIPTKKMAYLRMQIQVWVMGTGSHAKTRRKTFSTHVKALPVIGFPYTQHRRAARAEAGTEDDPVGPVTPSAVPTIGGSGTISRKATTVEFSRTISSDSADLDDEE